MKITHKIVRSVLKNYPRAIKVCSFGVVAITLAGGLGAGLSSLDDDIPIPPAVIETAENMETKSVVALADETKKKKETTSLKKIATQESPLEVKNQVAYVSTVADPAVEMKVYAYFSDIPELIYVAECESTFRHYGSDGKVLRGNVVSADVGVMQINERYHYDRAQSLGYDIHTLEGNLGYARYLYEKQGLKPWSASRSCWSHKHAVAKL